MEIPPPVVSAALESLSASSFHDDSPSEVLAAAKWPEDGESRRVEWRVGDVTFKVTRCVKHKRALRAQLLQSAHFIFHRLSTTEISALPLYRVIIDGAPHVSNSDGFAHVRYNLIFSDGLDREVVPIHVRYDWPKVERLLKSHVGLLRLDLGYTRRPNEPYIPFYQISAA